MMSDEDEMDQKLFSFDTISDECFPCPSWISIVSCCPILPIGKCGDPAAVEEAVRYCLERDGMNIDELCFQESIMKVLMKHSAAYCVHNVYTMSRCHLLCS